MSAGFMLAFAAYGGVQQYVITDFEGQGRSSVGFVSLILVYVSISICAPLAAAVVARVGAKPAMLSALPFYSLFMLALATNAAVTVWLASIALGVAGSVLWNGQNTYLVRAARQDALGTSAGYFSTFLAAGTGVGVVIAGFAVARTSYAVTFAVAALLPLAAGVCLARITDIRVSGRSNRLRHALGASRSVTAWRLSGIWFSTSFVFGLALSAIPVAIRTTLGFAFVGVLTSCFYVIPILTAYIAGNQSDIRGRRALLLAACATGVSGLTALILSGTGVLLVAGVLLLAAGNAMVSPVANALVGDVATENNLEAIVSMFRLAQGTGTIAALALASMLHGTTVFIISLAGLVVCFAVAMPVLRDDMPQIRRRIASEAG
jgi:MFS family permease